MGAAPPPRRRRLGRIIVVGAALAALVPLLVGVIVLWGLHTTMASTKKTPGPSSGTMKVAWSLPPVKGNTTGIALAGSWLDGGTIVDGRPDGLVAYSVASGQQAWGLQAPEGLRACAMSTVVSNDIGIVGFGSDQYTCDQIAAVDLHNGSQLWRADLASHTSIPMKLSDPSITVSRNIVAVRTASGSVRGYDLSDGTLRWQTPAPAPFADPSCTAGDVGAGRALVYVIENCIRNNGTSFVRVVGYDSSSGRSTWQGDASQISGQDYPTMLSANPLILADSRTNRGYAYTGSSTAPARIDLSLLSKTAYSIGANHSQKLRPRAFAIAGNVFYGQGPDQSGGSTGNGIVAIDLTTGKQLWSKTAGTGVSLIVISADATGVHAMAHEDGKQASQLVTLAGTNGAISYGRSSTDPRIVFTPEDMMYLTDNAYLVDLPAFLGGTGAREIVVLSGAR